MKQTLKLLVFTAFLLAAAGAYCADGPCPKEDINCLCKDNEFCKKSAILLSSEYPWNIVENTLKNNNNQKQELFYAKYHIVSLQRKYRVTNLELPEIKAISNYNELKAFLNDMPITIESFEEVIKLIKKFYDGSQEQRDFIDNIIYHLQTHPVCYGKLNINLYSLSHFCLVDRDIDNFNYETLIKKLEDIKQSK